MMLGTYAKAALPLIPGASKLPFVAGGGGSLPPTELTREVTATPDDVAAYTRVCAFTLRDTLPPTYPHILAFPLHMQLMTSGDFPFPAIGTLHLENRITVKRPIGIGEQLTLSVRAKDLAVHPKGRTFVLHTQARAGAGVVWESDSLLLRRGDGAGEGSRDRADAAELPFRAEWRLAGDLGRRYASVSGDSNPIHMHPLTAKLFGFPRAIAHGMWTKARCLAALEPTLPDAYTVDVAFKRPILLPGRVEFAAQDDEFEVRSSGPHLRGRVTR